MTRVNTVCPTELSTKHLVAEYREIGRICRLAASAEKRGYTPDTYGIPEAYTLGKGHMKFFANKIGYIHKRFALLVQEMKRRGYKVSFETLDGLPHPEGREWYFDWLPTDEAIEINRQRIKERS